MNGALESIGRTLGLIYREDGEPLPGGPSTSRYARGAGLSPRLDQDLDALLARVAELEARVAALESRD
jgi:hypothetical protein